MREAKEYSVLLLEDMPSIRICLAELIAMQPGLSLQCAAATCAEAREAMESGQPDVLVADLGLPDGSGIDVIREARKRFPDIEVMVLSVFDDEENVVQALEAGATGYLLKEQADGIGDAIRALVRGESMINPKVARFLLKRFTIVRDDTPVPETVVHETSPALSEREYDVLNCIAKGYSYGEIAELLDLSMNTIRTHIRNIYRKLAVCSRSEAVFEAANRGIINLTGE